MSASNVASGGFGHEVIGLRLMIGAFTCNGDE